MTSGHILKELIDLGCALILLILQDAQELSELNLPTSVLIDQRDHFLDLLAVVSKAEANEGVLKLLDPYGSRTITVQG